MYRHSVQTNCFIVTLKKYFIYFLIGSYIPIIIVTVLNFLLQGFISTLYGTDIFCDL